MRGVSHYRRESGFQHADARLLQRRDQCVVGGAFNDDGMRQRNVTDRILRGGVKLGGGGQHHGFRRAGRERPLDVGFFQIAGAQPAVGCTPVTPIK